MESLQKTRTRHYGCHRDHYDPEEVYKVFSEAHNEAVKSTPKVDLRNRYMPPVYDQGQLGSCTGNGLSAAYAYQYYYEHDKDAPSVAFDFIPSRLFIYYNERVPEGTVGQDSGATIADGIKVISSVGVCDEKVWPYDIAKYTEKPPETAYEEASKNKCYQFKRVVPNAHGLKTALAAGTPVVIGFSVPASFEEVGPDGIFRPRPREQILGGHCVVACGYNDDKHADGHDGFLLIRNSWGTGWGVEGYCWMPYSFANAGFISDAWVISEVE